MDDALLGLSLVVILSVLARLSATWMRVPPIVPLLVVDPARKYLTGDEDDAAVVSEFFEAIERFAQEADRGRPGLLATIARNDDLSRADNRWLNQIRQVRARAQFMILEILRR